MKKRCVTGLLLTGMVCIILGSCGIDSKDNKGNAEGTEENAKEIQSGETETKPDDGKGTEETGNPGTLRQLTAEELQAFTDYINEKENYGFLLSVYDTPAEVDLDQVFYSGAGIAAAPLSEEEAQEYLAVTGQEEIYTDVTRIEAAKLDEFLLEKTGLTYAEMKRPLDGWAYLAKYDIYCMEHGDTNYQTFTCTSGSTPDEKTFTLRFAEDSIYTGDEEVLNGYRQLERELAVEKNGDGYRFCSNRIVTEDGRIPEQTFEINVAEFGDVTFAAYEPDYDKNPQADVTFMLLSQKGEVLQTLSGVCENNIRAAAEYCDGVEAVSFPDYNGDGYTDAITITDYSYVQGPDVGTGFAEVRVYSGNEYGYFYYEDDLSDIINTQVADPTIQEVRDFLSGINFYGTWKITSCAGTASVYALSQEEIDAKMGTILTYERNFYTWNGESTWVVGYDRTMLTAEEFQNAFKIPLSALGVQEDQILEISADQGGTFGDYAYVVDQDTLLVFEDGVFFTAERAD